MMKTIKIKPIDNKRYEVVEDYITAYGFTIKAGFKFNGANIPRWLWFLFGGPYAPGVIRAAAVHDHMYGHSYPRKAADQAFRDILVEDGTSKFKAGLMKTGVRAFGWLFYKEA